MTMKPSEPCCSCFSDLERLKGERDKLLADWREQDEALQRIDAATGVDGTVACPNDVADHVDLALEDERQQRAALSSKGERDWQPIESAPKDGTAVLLTGDAPLCVGPFIGVWDADPEYPETWATGNCRTAASAITHWQALPPPPEKPKP